MLRFALVLCAVIFLAACTHNQAERSPYAVDEVLERAVELDGRDIQVIGYLGECGRLSCRIANKPITPRKVLSIGASAEFDRSVEGNPVQLVIISATFDISCLKSQLNILTNGNPSPPCFDRAEVLKMPKLIRVVPDQL